MGEEENSQSGAGAPPEQPKAAQPTAPEPPHVAEPSPQVTARAESIAETIRAARNKPGATGKERLIREVQEKIESDELRQALGMDVPFDIKKLLTKGSVEQRGMKIAEDTWVDMHTLTKAEDILAERIVEELNGHLPLNREYIEAKLVAVLAMSITRINRDRFPGPDIDTAARKTEEWKADWEVKIGLAKVLMAMDPNDIDALSIIYSNLDKMDVLIQEEAKKKSS